MLVGCAVDAPPPPASEPVLARFADRTTPALQIRDPDPICALAAELPAGDICALVCDPDALAAQLAADGSPAGTCYELGCTLPGDTRVTVGVCLPPN